MIIAVSLIQLPLTPASTAAKLYEESFVRMAKAAPEHQFIFISGHQVEELQSDSKNISVIISQPKADSPLLWKIWLDYTLPAIVRKCKADMLINTNATCSLRTKLPQCMLITGLFFLKQTELDSKKKYRFFKTHTAAFLQKSSAVITTSLFLKNKIIEHFNTDHKKIEVVYPAPDDLYQPIDWKEKDSIKERYTEGKEYFLYTGDAHPENNLMNLLKAFSFFKKRQKSNMQLVIAMPAPGENAVTGMLKGYKYRDEVKVIIGIIKEDIIKLTGSAYAFVYPYAYESFPIFSFQAMQCEVPVITGSSNTFREVLDEAVLYAEPENFEDIANKMMLVFKDESKRNELIDKGKLQVQKYSLAKADNSFHQYVTAQLATKYQRAVLPQKFKS